MLKRQCNQLKEQQELHQTTFLPIKCLSDVVQNQLQRAQLEGNKLKVLLPSLQTAVAQTTSNISAVQTSLQKLNELLTQDRDWATPVHVDHTARDSMISEGNIQVRECTSEANSLKDKTHNAYQTTFATIDSRQNQSTDRQISETIQANTYQNTTKMRRTKSDSAGARTGLKAHHVVSDKPTHPDIYDPQLQLALQRRRERVEAMSSSQ